MSHPPALARFIFRLLPLGVREREHANRWLEAAW